MLVRLLSFRPSWPGDVTDQFLRKELLPALAERPGLTAVYAARGSADDGDQRIVVSVWATDRLSDPAADEIASVFDFELAEVVSEPSVELLVPEFAFDFERPEPAQILRIFRGKVLAGQLDAYIEEARAGTLADSAAEHGPHVLYLGKVPPDAFVTLSVWAGWDRIQTATGGNIRQPVATKHSHLLESGTAWHYEIVPNTMAGRTSSMPSVPRPDDESDPPPRPAQMVVLDQP